MVSWLIWYLMAAHKEARRGVGGSIELLGQISKWQALTHAMKMQASLQCLTADKAHPHCGMGQPAEEGWFGPSRIFQTGCFDGKMSNAAVFVKGVSMVSERDSAALPSSNASFGRFG